MNMEGVAHQLTQANLALVRITQPLHGGLLPADSRCFEKGVCKCHWTGILNRGSGGQGQTGVGFI